MSRLRTKGALLALRLPLRLDARVRGDARAAGVSPGLWLARFVQGTYLRGGRAALSLAPADDDTSVD